MSVSLRSEVCGKAHAGVSLKHPQIMNPEDLSPESLELPPCPPPGGGCHRWMYRPIHLFVRAGLEDSFIDEWVSYWLSRAPQPREIENTIRTVRLEVDGLLFQRQSFNRNMPHDEAHITYYTRNGPTQLEDFISRSPINPSGVSPGTALRALFQQNERTVIFTQEKSQGQLVWSHSTPDEKLDSIVRTNTGGAWFLLNPVCGEMLWVDRLQKRTRRSEENTTSFRHILIESDSMEIGLWLTILKQLPLPIVSVTLSGNKSAHSIIRLEATSIDQWFTEARAVAEMVIPLGACPGALTAVRLTRLPGVIRRDNGNEQRLIWLNPHPTPTSIAQFPKKR